jgi:hypothetical protein
MEENEKPIETEKEEKLLPHTTEKTEEDERPPLYISGFGVMGQSTPDVATGSTPLTRKDD